MSQTLSLTILQRAKVIWDSMSSNERSSVYDDTFPEDVLNDAASQGYNVTQIKQALRECADDVIAQQLIEQVDFKYTLKPGYQIYSVDVRFAEEVYVMPAHGFTHNHHFYVIASSDADVPLHVHEHCKDIDVLITRTQFKRAVNQAIHTYAFAYKFPGFAEGCSHEDYVISPFTKQDAKNMFSAVYGFSLGKSSHYVDIKVLAKDFKVLWASLGFWDQVSKHYRVSALRTLDRILNGTMSHSDALESLHGLSGMFNQTYADAVNFKDTDTHRSLQ